MKIDFRKCKIIQPEGSLLNPFCREMCEIFPTDKPLYDALLEKGNSGYPMENSALYTGETLLGNAGIFPFRVWYKGRQINLSGIGAVATMPAFRQKGVASYLLKYCLSIIDQKQDTSVLYTELPAVYAPAGFKVVNQDYPSVLLGKENLGILGCELREINSMNEKDFDIIRNLYSFVCPPYNGKVVRNADYWNYYRIMFDPDDKVEIAFCSLEGEEIAYVRYETEPDRLTVTEFCSAPEQEEAVGSLLSYLGNKSNNGSLVKITLALAKDHFIWTYLKSRNVQFEKESPGVWREIFMVRSGIEENSDICINLLWSLADKF